MTQQNSEMAATANKPIKVKAYDLSEELKVQPIIKTSGKLEAIYRFVMTKEGDNGNTNVVLESSQISWLIGSPWPPVGILENGYEELEICVARTKHMDEERFWTIVDKSIEERAGVTAEHTHEAAITTGTEGKVETGSATEADEPETSEPEVEDTMDKSVHIYKGCKNNRIEMTREAWEKLKTVVGCVEKDIAIFEPYMKAEKKGTISDSRVFYNLLYAHLIIELSWVEQLLCPKCGENNLVHIYYDNSGLPLKEDGHAERCIKDSIDGKIEYVDKIKRQTYFVTVDFMVRTTGLGEIPLEKENIKIVDDLIDAIPSKEIASNICYYPISDYFVIRHKASSMAPVKFYNISMGPSMGPVE